ncbi:MAG: FecR family protein, partial [Saprospiraceae bacterium]
MLKDDELLHKWVNDELNAEELAAFKMRPNYIALENLKKQTDSLSPPPFDEEVILKRILTIEKENAEKKVEKGKTRSIFRLVSYAAAAAIFFGVLWFMWPESSIVHMKLANGEKIEGYLPDESLFALNAGSTLSYDSETWATERTLQLSGEAFFKVEKGSTFQVKTDNGTVKVLGTEFNVRSRNGVLEVKCKEGKVAVLSSGGVLLEELELNDAIRVKDEKII